MAIEKRNVIEDKRTPNVKTASADNDRLEESARRFDTKKVTNDGQRKQSGSKPRG